MPTKESKDFLESLVDTEKEVTEKEEIKKEIVEEAEKTVEDKESKELDEFIDLVKEETGITKEQIEEWKDRYFGKVFIFRIDDKETYIYRYLARPEWKKILSSFSEKTMTEDAVNEQIFNNCLLYPIPSQELRLRIGAGTIDSLAYAIRLSSNFLPEDVIARSIVKV